MTDIAHSGRAQWTAFVREWSNEFISSVQIAKINRSRLEQGYPELAAALSTNYLGMPSASLEQIKLTEERLGIRFPDDYVAFLSVSNGWIAPGFESPGYMICPIEKVDCYSRLSPDALKIYLEGRELYFISGKVASSRSTEFLRRTIQLSEPGSAVTIVFDPESEARRFWILDFNDRAKVYSTFTDLMLYQREFCRESFLQVIDMLKA